MKNSDNKDEQKLRKLAKSMGYTVSRSPETEKNTPHIVELDLRDVTEILFS